MPNELRKPVYSPSGLLVYAALLDEVTDELRLNRDRIVQRAALAVERRLVARLIRDINDLEPIATIGE